jgi:hypothetical protein
LFTVLGDVFLGEKEVEGNAEWTLFQKNLHPGQLFKPFQRYITFFYHNICHQPSTGIIIHKLKCLSTLGAIKPTRISYTVGDVKQATAHIQSSADGTFDAFAIQELETTLLLRYGDNA